MLPFRDRFGRGNYQDFRELQEADPSLDLPGAPLHPERMFQRSPSTAHLSIFKRR